jgi:hypothetical protein
MHEMTITGIALGGMQEAQSRFERSAERISSGVPAPEDIVDLLSSRNQLEANVRVMKMAEEMEKRVIDIFA